MASARWQQVSQLYHAALGRPTPERAGFLREACAGDEALRCEVESLLAHEDAAAHLIETPALNVAAKMRGKSDGNGESLVGRQLGPYQILSWLGAGGMGEVYRARDTKLGRDVAIKILPAEFTADPDRRARFEREARLLASLNHAHIAQIYGLEESAGIQALVMELVPGETLAEIIQGKAKGPRPKAQGGSPASRAPKVGESESLGLWPGALGLTESLSIARQLCDALEAAHEKGIIHRDLKPANIKVTPDGVVKVLDFGLAKLSAIDGGGPDLSQSPTVTSEGTREGMLFGTAAYMSPEQARGQPVDKRTDIWAFGCVLYEILTGRAAFARGTLTDTLAAVVDQEVPWDALPEQTPSEVRKLLRWCLAKDLRQRLSDAGDARLELEDALSAPGPQLAVLSPGGRARTSRWAIALAAGASLIIASVVTGTIVGLATRSSPFRVTRLAMVASATAALSPLGVSRDFSISPNGTQVVYRSASGALVVRALDELVPITLDLPAESGHANPIFSPDGRWIAFSGAGRLTKVRASGGPVVPLTSFGGNERGSCWISDDTIIFANSDPAVGLLRMLAVGGEPEVLTTPNHAAGELDHVWPEALPGGVGVLFTIQRSIGSTEETVAVLDLHTRSPHELFRGGSHAQYVAPGYLIYFTAGTLRAVRFDLARLQVMGSSVPVVEGVADSGLGEAEASVSSDGTLVYRPAAGVPRETLVWVDRKGSEEPVGGPPARYVVVRLSPDGTRIASNPNGDISVWDLRRKTSWRLTSDPALDTYQVWTPPDGRRLVWSSGRDGGGIVMRAADGTGEIQQLTNSLDGQRPSSVTPDGKHVVVWANKPGKETDTDLMLLDLEGAHRISPLLATEFRERNGEVSPDGRWLAYDSDETGRFEVWVRPFPDVRANKWVVTTGGGTAPLWARRGNELFYRGPDGSLMGVRWTAGVGHFDTGPPTKILDAKRYVMGNAGFRQYDITPDGTRFLMIKRTDDSTAATDVLIVVQHFEEELKRLLPRK